MVRIVLPSVVGIADMLQSGSWTHFETLWMSHKWVETQLCLFAAQQRPEVSWQLLYSVGNSYLPPLVPLFHHSHPVTLHLWCCSLSPRPSLQQRWWKPAGRRIAFSLVCVKSLFNLVICYNPINRWAVSLSEACLKKNLQSSEDKSENRGGCWCLMWLERDEITDYKDNRKCFVLSRRPSHYWWELLLLKSCLLGL